MSLAITRTAAVAALLSPLAATAAALCSWAVCGASASRPACVTAWPRWASSASHSARAACSSPALACSSACNSTCSSVA